MAKIIKCLPGSDNNMVTLELFLPANDFLPREHEVYFWSFGDIVRAKFKVLQRSAQWDRSFLTREPEGLSELFYTTFRPSR